MPSERVVGMLPYPDNCRVFLNDATKVHTLAPQIVCLCLHLSANGGIKSQWFIECFWGGVTDVTLLSILSYT